MRQACTARFVNARRQQVAGGRVQRRPAARRRARAWSRSISAPLGQVSAKRRMAAREQQLVVARLGSAPDRTSAATVASPLSHDAMVAASSRPGTRSGPAGAASRPAVRTVARAQRRRPAGRATRAAVTLRRNGRVDVVRRACGLSASSASSAAASMLPRPRACTTRDCRARRRPSAERSVEASAACRACSCGVGAPSPRGGRAVAGARRRPARRTGSRPAAGG